MCCWYWLDQFSVLLMQTCSGYRTENYRNNVFDYFYRIHDTSFKTFYLENGRSWDSRPFRACFNGRSLKSFLSIKSQAFPSCETAFLVTINICSLLPLVSFINSQVLHLLYVHTLVPATNFATASERKYFPKIIPIFFRWNFMVFYLIFFGLIFELSMLISRPSDERLKTVLSQS